MNITSNTGIMKRRIYIQFVFSRKIRLGPLSDANLEGMAICNWIKKIATRKKLLNTDTCYPNFWNRSLSL